MAQPAGSASASCSASHCRGLCARIHGLLHEDLSPAPRLDTVNGRGDDFLRNDNSSGYSADCQCKGNPLIPVVSGLEGGSPENEEGNRNPNYTPCQIRRPERRRPPAASGSAEESYAECTRGTKADAGEAAQEGRFRHCDEQKRREDREKGQEGTTRTTCFGIDHRVFADWVGRAVL